MVSDSSSEEKRGGGTQGRQPRFRTYTEYFKEICPYYIAIGMTHEQFWDGDPWMVKDYEKANQIKQEQENTFAWLQGRYIYEAVANLAPVLRAFSKAKRPTPYPAEPYPLRTEISKRRAQEKQKRDEQGFVDFMNAWAAGVNQRMEAKKNSAQTKGGEQDAG